MYLLSYHEDGGFAGGGSSHNGDSELIIVEIGPDGPNWRPWRVFTSAHYGSADPASEWNPISHFPVASAPHPRVIVAEAKHANYAKMSDCPWYDQCWEGFGPATQTPAMVGEWVNIGSASHWFDIDPTAPSGNDCTFSLYEGSGPMECYRTSPNFNGWQTPDPFGGSLGYKYLLADFGF